MTVDSILMRDVREYDKYLIKKAKLDYLEIMFCDWIGKNKTNITTEDEESVQRKLDIETVKQPGSDRMNLISAEQHRIHRRIEIK